MCPSRPRPAGWVSFVSVAQLTRSRNSETEQLGTKGLNRHKKSANPLVERRLVGCVCRIGTCDLQVMSLTSDRTAPPRDTCFASSAGADIRRLGFPPPDQVRGPGGRSALQSSRLRGQIRDL